MNETISISTFKIGSGRAEQKVDEFNKNRQKQDNLTAKERQYMTEYGDVKLNYRPTMNRGLIARPIEPLPPVFEEPKNEQPENKQVKNNGPVMK